mmetsp:Transcript_51587/g.128388  ORF Transcript_51587/g.128388 Transcript_51587/m.128388 type:complete len:245 (+) Transcript_51587:460-1194(+)
MTSSLSAPMASRAFKSSTFTPSMKVITMTFAVMSPGTTLGKVTSNHRGSCSSSPEFGLKFLSTLARLFPSTTKSSSFGTSPAHSLIAGDMSKSGSSLLTVLPMVSRFLRSWSSRCPTLSCWTLMTTSVPSASTARCTWAMEAHAMGSSPTLRNTSSSGFPNSLSICALTSPHGREGMLSWHLPRWWMKGCGMKSAREERYCPSFTHRPSRPTNLEYRNLELRSCAWSQISFLPSSSSSCSLSCL